MEVYLETMMEQLNSGEIKDYLQDHVVFCHHWSDEKWKSIMSRGGNKKRFQYCTDSSRTVLYLRALQGHSGRNLIDPSLQDNVVIPDGFFKYNYHVRCAINLDSIINSGLMPGGQNLRNKQTVFFPPADPHGQRPQGPRRDRPGSTAFCTIHAPSMEETSEYGVLGRHQSCSEERIEVQSSTIERHHSSRNTPKPLGWKLKKS